MSFKHTGDDFLDFKCESQERPGKSSDQLNHNDGSTESSDSLFDFSKSKRWRNHLLVGIALLASCGLIVAIVVPVCIANDCSGMAPTTPIVSSPASERHPVTTKRRTNLPTTTVTTTKPTTTTTTRRPPPTLPTARPTLTPPETTPAPTQPPEYIDRDPLVTTNVGPILGHIVEVDVSFTSSKTDSFIPGVISWYGIPFAKPPVGDLRWRRPVPVEPWNATLIADRQTPVCVQGRGTLSITHPNWPDELIQEDCLYLHITAPRNSVRKYPVMFWIYGGSFNSGANVQYPGHFLSMMDVVVVTLNYRLNIMGFASTESGEVKGNYGLWDQLEALKWVHSNIEAFGGNPDNITIFGESAGAASVGLLLSSPKAKGYFSQAILQSGNEYAIWAVNGEEVHPHSYIVQVAEQFGCTNETSGGLITTDDEMMDCLRTKDASELRRANFDCNFCLGFSPVIDGQGGILPKMPLDLRQERLSSEVPIMHGTNTDECTIGFVAVDPTLVFRGINRTEFEWALNELVEHFKFFITENDTEDAVRKAVDMWYTPWPYLDNGRENKVALSKMCLDAGFVASSVDQLRHHSIYARTYKYAYGYQVAPRIPPAILIPDWIGVPHALELPFVFGLPFIDDNPAVASDAGNFSLDVGVRVVFSDQDKEWAEYTMRLWTNFAKYGNPTPQPISPPGGLPAAVWEEFTEESHKYFLLGVDHASTQENYRSQDVTFFNNYINGIARGADFHNPFGFLDIGNVTSSSDRLEEKEYVSSRFGTSNNAFRFKTKTIPLGLPQQADPLMLKELIAQLVAEYNISD